MLDVISIFLWCFCFFLKKIKSVLKIVFSYCAQVLITNYYQTRKVESKILLFSYFFYKFGYYHHSFLIRVDFRSDQTCTTSTVPCTHDSGSDSERLIGSWTLQVFGYGSATSLGPAGVYNTGYKVGETNPLLGITPKTPGKELTPPPLTEPQSLISYLPFLSLSLLGKDHIVSPSILDKIASIGKRLKKDIF